MQQSTHPSRRIALWLGLALALPLAVACQGQMREQVSYRSMEKPLEIPADTVSMGNEEINLDYPPGDTGGPPNPVAYTPKILDLGKRKYEAQCAPCHGLTGDGKGKVGEIWLPPPPPVNDARIKAMSDGQLYIRIVKGGAANGALMPAYDKKLTLEERWAVVNYIKSSLAK